LKKLSAEKNIVLNINFSSRTTSLDCQKTIEENVEKRSFKQYGPTGGRQLVVFVDDCNMPKIDTYGTQQPIALLKFLIDKRSLYQRGGDLELHEIVDTQFIAACTPAGGGNNPLDPRYVTLFSTFNITFPSESSIEKIYTSIMEKHVQEFAEEIQQIVPKFTTATMKLYYIICEKLPRTPVKFHYIFNLRDLSRVYEGMMQSTLDKFASKDSFVRLWRNECLRVFGDRLINEEDRGLITDGLLPDLVKEFFPGTEEYVLKNPILFGDYLLADPLDEEVEDPRLYEDLGDFDKISTKLNKMLEDYGYENKPMNLVLFNDALDHLTKIHRIIRMPRGSALLVGVGGSGK
jgi:dynein heavy chain